MSKTLPALAAALMLALPAYGVDEHHPEQQAAPQAPENTVQQMQENAKKMQSQLDRIAAAKTADERRQAIAEHMQTMGENMMLGQQMAMADGGCPMMGMMGGNTGMMGGMGMMGPGGMGGMMRGPGAGGMDPEAMMNRMQQMEKRMDMMQMMMERQMGGARRPTPQGN